MLQSTSQAEIINYFKQFTNQNISENTSINNDIGLVVSDFTDIADFFKKKFNVDLRKMDENIYFNDEVSNPFKFLYYKFTNPEKLKKPPITIGHLEAVVNVGYWFDPPS